MKRSMIMTLALCLLTLVAMAGLAQVQRGAPGQEPENLTALQQQFTAELRRLRLEVLQQGIEFQEWKIKQLEREAQQVRSEQQRLEEQERALKEQIAALDQQAGNPAPPEGGAVGELEAMRAELTGKRLKSLRTQQQPILQRESELAEQLKQEQERLQELLKKAKKLRAEG